MAQFSLQTLNRVYRGFFYFISSVTRTLDLSNNSRICPARSVFIAVHRRLYHEWGTIGGLRMFDIGLAAFEPADGLGITIIPMDPFNYETWDKEPDLAVLLLDTPPSAPIDRCFYKISIRAEWQKHDDYMLIDGLSTKSTAHPMLMSQSCSVTWHRLQLLGRRMDRLNWKMEVGANTVKAVVICRYEGWEVVFQVKSRQPAEDVVAATAIAIASTSTSNTVEAFMMNPVLSLPSSITSIKIAPGGAGGW